jgi:hypothetical protein
VQVPNRVHDLWITPHGVIKAAQKSKAKLEFRTQGGRQVAAVSFTESGQYAATAFINAEGLVERVESIMPNPVLGDTRVITTYEDYRQHGAIRFPARIRQSAGGYPVLDLAVSESSRTPRGPAVPTTCAAAEKVITRRRRRLVPAGALHHSVAIEMKDHDRGRARLHGRARRCWLK